MAATDKSYTFRSILRGLGIGECSPSIPPGVGFHLKGIPYPGDLVPIPNIESFPIPSAPEKAHLSQNELRDMFVKRQFEEIARKSDPNQDNCEELLTVDIPGTFRSIGHFLQFKQELNALYEIKSKELGISGPIKVCQSPMCLNSSVPTFSYCANHLYEDPKYEEQKFIKQCEAEGCLNVCSMGQKLCCYHKSSK